ncbi:MAG: hypothetical protein Q8L36_00745 [bacterium]|nr:hypothetical protein [bacterium]
MEPILKSEIFFFIASTATVVMMIILTVAGFYLIGILRNFHAISAVFKKAVDNADESLEEIAERIKNSLIFQFLFGKRKSKKSKKNE